MIPPVLLIIGVGNRWRIPFPLFLLWPFFAVVWLALTLFQLFVGSGRNARQGIVMGKQALAVFGHLSGLRIEVESKDGRGVNIRII